MMQQEDCKRLDLHQTGPTAEQVYLIEPDAGWRNNVQATISTAETRIDAPAKARDLKSSISIALAGSGGSGVMTAGTLLLNAAAKAGLYGLMVRSRQIRSGKPPSGAPRSTTDAFLDDGVRPAGGDRLASVGQFCGQIIDASSVMIGDPTRRNAEVFKNTGARYFRCR
jgi:2-oxoglutarate ferredoxin oxidoreductase subunit alpha